MTRSWPATQSSATWTRDIRRIIAAWLGPTKLARAILYATITNIVAYLPFLMLSGDTGKFMITAADRNDLRADRVAASSR